MSIYLSSFYPLKCTKKGREAVSNDKLHPYIDGSCRREPDFENKFPPITGLCRPGFSKRLHEDDIIIYITNKKGINKHYLIAILKVIDTANSHNEAEKWYKNKNYSIPNNLIISATKPFQLEKTHQFHKINRRISDPEKIIELWNNYYKKIVDSNPEVAICEIWNKHKYLINPPELDDKNLNGIFNTGHGTMNPHTLTDNEWNKFKKWLNLTITKSNYY